MRDAAIYPGRIRRCAIMLALCPALSGYSAMAQTPDAPQPSSAGTLQKYIDLRAADADWNEISKLVEWPDDPAWDCKWVDSGAAVGQAEAGSSLPVTYNRLGLYCDDYTFTQKQETVIVHYQMKPALQGWIVSAPVPDYPDVSVDTLQKQLKEAHNAKAEEIGRRLSGIVSGTGR